MITTSNTKPRGGKPFQIGPDTARETILLVGSCRVNAHINYFDRYNRTAADPVRVFFVDPHDAHWNDDGQQQDLESALLAMESNPNYLNAIKSATVYLHEHYGNFGMWNAAQDAQKNIYQFGMSPRLDICIPNFHDRFVLFQERMNLDPNLQISFRVHGGMTPRIFGQMRHDGLDALEKFYSVCALSSFPEMAAHVRENWTKTRFFWTGNHVSAAFTLYLFRQLNDRFLHLPLDDEFWQGAATEDLFAKPCTPVTQYDVDAYGLTWPDTPIASLKP